MRDGPIGPLQSLNHEDLWNILSFMVPMVVAAVLVAVLR